ncbi:hypothetical protein HDV00_009174 [Rhizophlyctis rosea]|nr:hypothetical protein HDV00_009174 [Rhizophlyctis rosea]
MDNGKKRTTTPSSKAGQASRPATASTAPKGALHSVVSSLTRAAVGGAASDIQDDDIDRYVAELIAQEAAVANKRYDTFGVSAFLGQKKNLPKPNKRFLSNVIKSTDAHNEALLRKEREEAEDRLKELKRKRREELNPDSRDRRRRHRDRESGDAADGRHDRDSRKRRRRERDDRVSEYESDECGGDRHRPTGIEHKVGHSSDRSRSRSPKGRLKGGGYRRGSESDDDSVAREVSHSAAQTAPSSVMSSQTRPITDSRSTNPAPQPTPHPTSSTPSPPKMRGRGTTGSTRLDKYFSAGYDPRLDLDNYDDNSLLHYIENLEELQMDLGAGTAPLSPAHRGEKKERKRKKDKKKKKKKKREREKVKEKERDRSKGRRDRKGRSRSRSRSVDHSSSDSNHLSASDPDGDRGRRRRRKERDRSLSRSVSRSQSPARGRDRSRSGRRARGRDVTRSPSIGPHPARDLTKRISGPRTELPMSCPW